MFISKEVSAVMFLFDLLKWPLVLVIPGCIHSLGPISPAALLMIEMELSAYDGWGIYFTI